MNWGAGPALGLLTVSGYLLSLAGAALVWRKRGEFSVWVQDEISVFRRNFSRYTPAGPFYAIREERAGRGIAGEVAAENGNLILDPYRKFAALAPHECGSSQGQKIAGNGKKPERRACSPVHKSSQAPTRSME